MKTHTFSNSSTIASCGYDEEKKCLTIQFTSGSSYEYDDCSEELYKDLTESESPGKFFSQNIKQLKFRKL